MQKKLILIMTFLFVVSCSSVHKFINNDIKPDGKVAVIIAETQYSDIHSMIANSLTDLLEAKSKLHVVHQDKVKTIIGAYPVRIRGPYTLLGDEVELDYAHHDMDTLAGYAKKLNVNYLYVFWIPRGTETKIIKTDTYGFQHENSGFIYYNYIGELIEFPSRRIIAQGQTELLYLPNAIVLGWGGPPTSSKEMVKDFSESAVNEIIKKTGISK